jgi:hypothetical protein
MCNAASDGDRYSGRTEPAEVSGGHGDGVAAALIFVCVSCEMYHKAKSFDIGRKYEDNGPIYTIIGYEWCDYWDGIYR